jgi:hypothetical protein
MDHHRHIYRQLEQADAIVVGVQSSGNRLVLALLRENPDFQRVMMDPSHGRMPLPELTPVVLIERDPEAVAQSLLRRDDLPAARELTDIKSAREYVATRTEQIRQRFPDAVTINYESLVADRDSELASVAESLSVSAWKSSIEVTDENAKYGLPIVPAESVESVDDAVGSELTLD